MFGRVEARSEFCTERVDLFHGLACMLVKNLSHYFRGLICAAWCNALDEPVEDPIYSIVQFLLQLIGAGARDVAGRDIHP
jgi:hypothetical protein